MGIASQITGEKSMKKLLLSVMVITGLFAFTGCMTPAEQEQTVEESFITAEEIAEYKDIIEDTFNSFYWYYDDESVEFSEKKVPSTNTDFGKAAIKASEDAGWKLGRFSGDNLICAEVTLLHYNGNTAGIAYVYLDDGEVKGIYYSPVYNANKAYSLNDRNIFTAKADFTAFETNAPIQEFDVKDFNYMKKGFSSSGDTGSGNFMAAVTDDGKATIYTVWGKSATSMVIDVNEGESVIDCAVSGKEDGLNMIAVIVGRKNETGDDAESRVMPERIVIYNKEGSVINYIEGDEEGYSFVDFDKGYIMAGHGEFIDFYRGDKKEKTIYTGINITAIKKCDFDGDGKDEYAVTDGLDLYVCRLDDSGMDVLWRTNISSVFFDGNIYTGDLNADGVSEIYLIDNNGSGVKYTLTEKGFKYGTVGENGEAWYVADFNLDGKSDYIEATKDTGVSAKMYLAK